MKYLLDTCTISYFIRGEGNVIRNIQNTLPTDICISTITIMELEFGLQLNLIRAKKLRPILSALFDSIHILPFTFEDAHSAAVLRATLQKSGTPIGSYDVLLAGCALNRNLIFITGNNKEFKRVANLKVDDWR